MSFSMKMVLLGVGLLSTSIYAADPVELSITSTKNEFKLGELVDVRVSFTNRTGKPIEIGGDSRNWATIKIASPKDPEFRFYAAPSLGFTLDGYNFPTVIRPRSTLTIPRTILWNYKPEVSHLNPRAAAPETEGRILNYYAFPTSGAYFIKYVALVHRHGAPVTHESEPIEITVVEPTGDNLNIWTSIREEPLFSLFAQEPAVSRIRRLAEPERKAMLERIDNIIAEYPNSVYARQFRKSLKAYNAQSTSLVPK